ncbi:canalicular multispecific organic anion transporter, partial [Achlya hypogyna]
MPTSTASLLDSPRATDAAVPAFHVKSPTPLASAPVRHPTETANIMSAVTLSWLSKLIRDGAKLPLQEADVWPVRRADSAAALHPRFAAHWAHEKAQPRPSFAAALLRTLMSESVSAVGLYFASSFLSLLQPIIIKSILQVLAGEAPTLGIASGYGLAVLLTATTLVSVTLIDYGQAWMTSVGANARTIGMDAVFAASLSRSTVSAGEVVTLASVDAERLYLGYLFVAWTLSAPVTLLCIFVLLGLELGLWPAAAGAAAMFAMLYGGYASATSVGTVRSELLSTQAQRLQLTNEGLQGVRGVKLNVWEAPLRDVIAHMREKELTYLKTYQFRRILNMVVLSVAPVLSLALCLTIFALQGYDLSAATAFTTLAFMNNARHPCTVFANAVVAVAEAKVSAQRIGDFLTRTTVPAIEQAPTCTRHDVPAVDITNGDF